MPQGQSISILGAGAWGTALASAFARSGKQVKLWGRTEQVVEDIRVNNQNNAYLPGVTLPKGIIASTDLKFALTDAGIVLFSTPAQITRHIAEQIGGLVGPAASLIACAKGIEQKTGFLQTEILSDLIPLNPSGALSGPSFASDVAAGLPTAVVLAMADLGQAQDISQSLSSNYLRVYASDDARGVQIGGALKNVIAIAVGICRGGGLGASAEAALVARGYAEITRVAAVLGAKPETLTGLSGLGDLFLTCSSTLSRNFSYGIAIGSGRDRTGMKLAEGIHTVGIACQIAKQHHIAVPICDTTQQLIDGQITIGEAHEQLMGRPVKSEV